MSAASGTAAYVMVDALDALCRLFGGCECDHCGWVAQCETTSADTASCARCSEAVESVLPDPRNVRWTQWARGEL